jgi:hypothetical protein
MMDSKAGASRPSYAVYGHLAVIFLTDSSA